MLNRKGFTIIEMLVVLIVVATVAALAWPNYMAIKEKASNREAKATLALIRAAEKVYKMEEGFYYPHLGTANNAAIINQDLKLSLPASATVSWSVSLTSPTLTTGFANAQRSGGQDTRIWNINFSGDADPTCSGGYPSSNCN